MKIFLHSEDFSGHFLQGRWCKKLPFLGAWNPQNGLGGQKMRFFKVQDIDTIIEPGEKEHQTDVSSALKRFGDHPCRFWDIMKFWTAAPWFGPLLDFPYKVVVWGSKSRKLMTFSKSTYCLFQNMGPTFWRCAIFSKSIFRQKFWKFQSAITFFLSKLYRRPRYEKYSIFHELFEKQRRVIPKRNKSKFAYPTLHANLPL